MMTLAQLAVERVVNTLPEGLLIALCAWLLLRLMGRQNSGTRFAVWFVALAAVVGLPFLSSFARAHTFSAQTRPEIAVPAFWSLAFFILWIAIAAAALARVAVGILQVRQIRSGCTEIAPSSIAPELRALLAETKRPVRLLVSDKARVPAALGFRNPAVVLPAWALRDLTAAELRVILIHELAHLRRHDDWTNLLQKSVRAILFFHPAVWWIDARLSMEREMACDDAVLAATGDSRAYAGTLIGLLEKGCARRGWTMAQAAVARARHASVRIARILRSGPGATTRVGRAALGLATSVSVLCGGLALFAPRLVEFVPMESSSAARIAQPFTDSGLNIPAAGVVPASFHPDQQSHASMTRTADAHRKLASHREPVRKIAAPKPHTAAKTSLVMASLSDFIQPMPLVASLTVSDADQNVPIIVVFETRQSSTAAPKQPAQLRIVSAQPATTTVQQLQSREDPALQIEMLQAIDPATGTPVRILHIVLVVPQQTGSASQSI